MALRAAVERSRDPLEFERGALFNLAYSEPAWLAGVDLAFVAGSRPKRASQPGTGRNALVGWRDRSPAEPPVMVDLSDRSVRQFIEKELEDVESESVVRASPSLPSGILRRLEQIGYSFEIPGTRDRTLYGWQAETLEEAREWVMLRPSARPTMGLLARTGKPEGSSPSLVLTSVNDLWHPQTDVGAYGIIGGPQLLQRRPLFFVEEARFRTLKLTPLSPLRHSDVLRRWGRGAAERTEPHRLALVVGLEVLE